MRNVPMKRLGLAFLVLGVVIGCGSLFQHIASQATSGGEGAFALIDSDFSNDNVSASSSTEPVDQSPVDGAGQATLSFFTAFQIDPDSEDTAGPKFAKAGDINGDGLLDLVSAWNQSQPVQLHLQQRDADGNISFRTVTIAGTTPVAVVGGLGLGYINDDCYLDIVVLVKATAAASLCPPENPMDAPKAISLLEGEIIVYFNPGCDPGCGRPCDLDCDLDCHADCDTVSDEDCEPLCPSGCDILIADGDQWQEMTLVNQLVRWIQTDPDTGAITLVPWVHNQWPGADAENFETAQTEPENGGFTDLIVANIDGIPGDDIVVAQNVAECDTLGMKPPLTLVDLWVNPGGPDSEDASAWGTELEPGIRGPVTVMADLPQVKDIEPMDVDDDGDLDIVATFTNAISRNIRWARNPLDPPEGGGTGDVNAVTAASQVPPIYLATEWERRPVGSLDTGADVMTIADVDSDGADDVVIRSTVGQIVQWFRRPTFEPVPPEFPPPDPTPDRFNFPWQVYTLTEFDSRVPQALSAGDIDGDSRIEIMVAAGGGVLWFDESPTLTPYDPWLENLIIQDGEVGTSTPATGATGGSTGNTNDNSSPGGSGVGVGEVDTSTQINALLVVDLDNDGYLDVIGTLDRRTGAGLSDDRLVWYRNTLGDP